MQEEIKEIDSKIAVHYEEVDRLLQVRISLIPGDASEIETVSKIHDLIDASYCDSRMSIEFIAKETKLSNPKISTLINKYLGAGLPKLVSMRRIRKAKMMMSETNKSDKQIAYAVGFEDSHFFSRTFKRMTGITPSEFRKGKAA